MSTLPDGGWSDGGAEGGEGFPTVGHEDNGMFADDGEFDILLCFFCLDVWRYRQIG